MGGSHKKRSLKIKIDYLETSKGPFLLLTTGEARNRLRSLLGKLLLETHGLDYHLFQKFPGPL